MRGILSVLLLLVVSGCQTVSYYAQSASGQLQIIHRARPIQQWLEDPRTPAELKTRLESVAEIRRFASRRLRLPDNRSYTLYADLGRPYAVWSLFAAPALSLNAHQWCYPVIGCQAYRGYFKKQAALDLADELGNQGFDVSVGGVRAYSTLGWFDDPVLNTFVDYSATDMAALIFHELAHQVVYAPGDTVFNESFATFVEISGVEDWLSETRASELGRYYRSMEYETRVIGIINDARAALEKVYLSGLPDPVKHVQKALVFEGLKRAYQRIRQSYPDNSAWDKWFSRPLNNANLVAVGAYYDQVPAFKALFDQAGADYERFYGKVRELAGLDKAERDGILAATIDTEAE